MGPGLYNIIKTLILFWFIFFYPNMIHSHVEHPKDQQDIGIDEKLGQYVPLDITFNDENGNRVSFRNLIRTPTILAPVYYSCPNVCSFLLFNLAEALKKLPADPGKEYIILAVSFDETEKPNLALEKKKMYLKVIEKPSP